MTRQKTWTGRQGQIRAACVSGEPTLSQVSLGPWMPQKLYFLTNRNYYYSEQLRPVQHPKEHIYLLHSHSQSFLETFLHYVKLRISSYYEGIKAHSNTKAEKRAHHIQQ
jgi:hypothetical protein